MVEVGGDGCWVEWFQDSLIAFRSYGPDSCFHVYKNHKNWDLVRRRCFSFFDYTIYINEVFEWQSWQSAMVFLCWCYIDIQWICMKSQTGGLECTFSRCWWSGSMSLFHQCILLLKTGLDMKVLEDVPGAPGWPRNLKPKLKLDDTSKIMGHVNISLQ